MSITSDRRGGARRRRENWSSEETALRVLTWLAAQADDDGEVTAAQRDIADALELGDRTVGRALTRLLETDRLELRRRGTGFPYSSRYSLASDDTTTVTVA